MNPHKTTKSNEKLIIEGDSLYEIDLNCMEKRKRAKEKEKEEKNESKDIKK